MIFHINKMLYKVSNNVYIYIIINWFIYFFDKNRYVVQNKWCYSFLSIRALRSILPLLKYFPNLLKRCYQLHQYMVFSLFVTLLVQFVVIDTHLKRVRDVDIEGHFLRKNGMSFYHVLYHYSTSKTFSN